MLRATDRAVRMLVVLASIATLVALLSGYVGRTLGNSDQFANRATKAVRDPATRSLVAERVTDQIVLEHVSELTTLRPLIKRGVSAAIASPAFAAAFRVGVRALHSALFNRDRRTLTVAVAGVGPVVAAKLRRVPPSASREVDRSHRIALITRNIGDVSARVLRALERVRVLAILLLVLAFGLALAAVALSRDRRRTVGWLAIGTTCVGLTLLVGLTLGRLVALHQVAAGAERDAASAVWSAFLGDLHPVAWVITGASVVIALVTLPRPRARVRRGPVAIAAGVLLSAIVVAAFAVADTTTEAAPATGQCLGHARLCSRSLDEVVLAATHNSMSAPLPGWFASQQDRPIPAQLQDGIRGLLIDTHYADRLPNGKLRTELGSRADALEDGVSPPLLERARHLRERAGFKGEGIRGMYLCHSFCELGATALEPVLRELRDFLIAHPGAVVVVVNQDYVTPVDFVGAVERAGLAELAYRGPLDGDLPTLREMIDKDERVVFLAENHAGAAPWYRPAYKDAVQETPFSFRRPAELTAEARLPASCGPNRGPTGAPLLLLNHWITTDPLPQPRNAAAVNAYGPLLQRIEECKRLRHHLANLVAVDFYRRGDLFRVVDHLNGVR